MQQLNSDVKVFTSLARPKRLSYIGSDGITYRFLVKSGDDLRKDMYAQELCSSLNDGGNKIKTYFIVVLGLGGDKHANVGLIEWVENVNVLKQIIQNGNKVTGVDLGYTKSSKYFEVGSVFRGGTAFIRKDAMQYHKNSGLIHNKDLKGNEQYDDTHQPKYPWWDLEHYMVQVERFKKLLVWFRPIQWRLFSEKSGGLG